MSASSRTVRRTACRLAVGAAVVLLSARAAHRVESSPQTVTVAPAQAAVAQAAPPSVAPPPVGIAELPSWDGQRLVPSFSPPKLDLSPMPDLAPAPLAVPEPSMMLLLLSGMCLSIFTRRRKRPF